jgi:hypothetical protein
MRPTELDLKGQRGEMPNEETVFFSGHIHPGDEQKGKTDPGGSANRHFLKGGYEIASRKRHLLGKLESIVS